MPPVTACAAQLSLQSDGKEKSAKSKEKSRENTAFYAVLLKKIIFWLNNVEASDYGKPSRLAHKRVVSAID